MDQSFIPLVRDGQSNSSQDGPRRHLPGHTSEELSRIGLLEGFYNLLVACRNWSFRDDDNRSSNAYRSAGDHIGQVN
jgi:hypothetical protein